MADNKEIQNYSAELYKTVTKFNPTPAQNAELNGWAGIQNVNQRLYDIADPIQANKEFKKLDANVQDLIKQQNPNATFIQEGAKKTVLNQVLDGLRSYANLVTGVYRGAKYAQQEKISFSKAWDMTRGDGEAFFDRDRVQKVDTFYSKGVAKVAKMASMGKTAGEILANINLANPEELQAYEDYLDVENNKTMQEALGDYNMAKISFGRDLAYDVFKLRVKPGEYGTLKRKAFGIVSATGDLATNIVFDPLTYIPIVGAASKLGSIGVLKAVKAAERAGAVGSDAYKATLSAKIGDAFDNSFYGKEVTRFYDKAGAQIERYAKGTDAEKNEAFGILNRQFGKDINQELIEKMAKAQVFNAPAAKKFFQDAQNFDNLVNGKKIYGKPILPTYSIYRGFKDEVKNTLLRTTGISTTKAGSAVAGIVGETLIKTIAKTDFLKDDVARNELMTAIKESAGKASKFARTFEIAPTTRNIKYGRVTLKDGTVIDEGLQSLQDVIRLGRIADLSRPDADELGRIWVTASVAERKNIHKGLVFAISDSLGLYQGMDNAQLMGEIEKFYGVQQYAKDELFTPAKYKALPDESKKLLDKVYEKDGGVLKAIKKEGGAIPWNPGRLGSDNFAATMEHQLVFELKTPDLRAIRAAVYSRKGAQLKSLGAVFNNKYSEAIVSTWTFLTLVPRLGIRSAIEEIGVFGLVATPKQIVSLITRGYRTSRAKNRSLNSDSKFLDERGVGYPSRALYSMFQPGVSKKIAKSVEEDGSIENVVKNMQMAYKSGMTGKGFFAKVFGTTDEQVEKDLEDIILYDIDSSGYKETTMTVTGGTSLNNFADQGYTTSSEVGKRYGRNLELSINYNKFKKQFNTEGPAVEMKLQENPDSYYMSWTTEAYKRTAGPGTSRIAIKYIDNPKKAIEEIRKELDNNPQLSSAFTNSLNENISNSELATSIYFSARQPFLNKAGDVNPKLVKLVYNRVDNKDIWTPDIDTSVLRLMDNKDLPDTVLSQKWVPIAENMGSFIKVMNEKGYKWMDRQITTLTREPIYYANLHYYRNQFRPLERLKFSQLVEKGFAPKEAETLSRQYAARIASDAASQRTLDFVDNPLIRTNLAFGLRNFARFYRATEDFWRRAYRIGGKQTDSIVRLRLATQGLEHSGFIYEDDQGELYFVFPGDDIIYNAVSIAHRFIDGNSNLKLPQSLQFSGKVKFLSPSLDPNSSIPTFSGPIAGISMVVLQQHAPNFWGIRDRLLRVTLGEMSKDATYKDVIFPPAIRRALSFMSPNDVNGEMASAQRQAYSYLVANGEGLDINATPEQKLEFQQNLEALASNILTTRFFLGLVSPVALSPSAGKDVSATLKDLGNVDFREEFYNTVNELTAQGSIDPWGEANMKWAKAKPGVLAYTISQSERSKVVSIAQRTDAINWLRNNEALVNKYPEGSAFFVPNTGDFDISESKFFQREGYLDKIPVEEFMTKVTAQEELNAYYAKRDEWDLKIESAPESIRSIITKQKQADMKEFTKDKYYLNKALETYGSAADNTAAWEELVRMIDAGDTPKSPNAQKVVEIVNIVQEANAMTKLMFDGTVDASQRRSLIRNSAMQQALDIAANDTGLVRIINTVVKKQLGV